MKLHYEVIRGTLNLDNGVKIVGAGSTSDKGQIEEIKRLAEVNDAMGKPQYVRIVDGKGEATQEDAPPPPADPPADPPAPPADPGKPGHDAHPFQHPPGVPESEVTQALAALTEGGLTFESANALSDADIKAQTKGIGDARIKLIRAVGTVNAYPAHVPPAE